MVIHDTTIGIERSVKKRSKNQKNQKTKDARHVALLARTRLPPRTTNATVEEEHFSELPQTRYGMHPRRAKNARLPMIL